MLADAVGIKGDSCPNFAYVDAFFTCRPTDGPYGVKSIKGVDFRHAYLLYIGLPLLQHLVRSFNIKLIIAHGATVAEMAMKGFQKPTTATSL